MSQALNAAPMDDTLHAYPVPRDQFAPQHGRPRRAQSLMRTFEAAAIMADCSTTHDTHLAPARAPFEDCASAFARGTLISTVMGPVAIEDLIPGDLIETHRGPEPVMWIGQTTFVLKRGLEGSTLTHLLRVTSDSMGRGGPHGDLLLGPGARLVIRKDSFRAMLNCDAVLAPAADYVDGDRILEVTPPGAVQLFHIALRRPGIIRANGLELESYHPGRNVAGDLEGDDLGSLLALFPHITSLDEFGDLAYPRSTRSTIEALPVM